ncbi:MAG: hypothetical protein HY665_03815 [Chloroflexi bacterium]|nr:hypothetical protein [Chloroflexota bacterium]
MAIAAAPERLSAENLKELRDEIEKRTGKSPEELYEERDRRVRDAIALKEPDRVPVGFRGVYFATRYAGLPHSAVFYDPAAHKAAVIKTLMDFEPDLFRFTPFIGAESGPALEILDAKDTRWPGFNLSADSTHQFVEEERMQADEYDLFLSDPTDFVLRYYLPRAYGALEPLSRLPSLTDRFTGFPAMTPIFTREEFKQVARSLFRAGQEKAKYSQQEREIAQLGFPPLTYPGGAGGSPFETLTGRMRTMRGIMTDMYRQPDKLLAACEKLAAINIAKATPADPTQKWNPRRVAGGGILTGADNYMSKKQFETFYWPTCKKAMQASIDLGFVPSPFLEARCDDRLEYLLELPKGKLLIQFEQTDMARAKDILRDHACIFGNVPPILLDTGSPQEVEEYCQKLIKTCAKGGGFILGNGSAMDRAKPENVKAMIDSAKKYGWY